MRKYYYNFIKIIAKLGWLPSQSSLWSLKKNGNSINALAHELVVEESLPSNFTQWELINSRGVTVAHLYARNKMLPVGFNKWNLKTKLGVTVASECFESNNFKFHYDDIVKDSLLLEFMFLAIKEDHPDYDGWDYLENSYYALSDILNDFKNLPNHEKFIKHDALHGSNLCEFEINLIDLFNSFNTDEYNYAKLLKIREYIFSLISSDQYEKMNMIVKNKNYDEQTIELDFL